MIDPLSPCKTATAQETWESNAPSPIISATEAAELSID
jgi:hypothetical protein